MYLFVYVEQLTECADSSHVSTMSFPQCDSLLQNAP